MDYSKKRPSINCNVKLLNKDLWQSFHKLTTEMIITKPGRRMFPPMRVQVENLNPNTMYCFLVEMVPTGNCRYRYSASTGWAPAGSEEAQSAKRIYVHPESPAPGHHWMSQAVSFSRLKLTNTLNPPGGHLVMSSMHKYQPRILVIECTDPRMLHDSFPSAPFVFPETQFIAVTAYQNDRMTKMKIDHNPFAKGFRETGQSMCKRKRQRMEQDRLERERTSSKNDNEDSGSDEDLIVVDDMNNSTKRLSPVSRSDDSGFGDMERCTPEERLSPEETHSSNCKSMRTMNYSAAPTKPVLPPYNMYQSHYINSTYPPMPPSYYPYYNPYYSVNPWPITYNLPHDTPYDLSGGKQEEVKETSTTSNSNNTNEFSNSIVKKEDIEQDKSKDVDHPVVRTTFTDFSIRAITGFA